MTQYFGVIGNRDHIKIKGEKRPFWEFLDVLPDGWLCSLAYHRDDVPRDRQTLWDCGAWSYKNQQIPKLGRNLVTPEWALSEYMRLGKPGDFVVCPDHMLIEGLTEEELTERRAFNTASATEFLELTKGTGFRPMAVIHGQSSEERVAHALHLRSLGYESFALGGMAARAAQKKQAIEMAAAVRQAIPGAWLHILGLSAPSFMAEWDRIGIDACDGSSHFKQAFTAGAWFEQDGSRLIKHQAAHVDRETREVLPSEPITAPICECLACSRLRAEGVDTRTYGSNETNMGRAAHNLNALMRAQQVALSLARTPVRQTVHLVSCVGLKTDYSTAAADLYRSQWFLKARRYVEAQQADWHILSALHGYLPRTQITDPYELTLNTMSKADRAQWADKVLEVVQRTYQTGTHFVFLAGDKYRTPLTSLLEANGYTTEAPMKGLGIGQQLAWLDLHTPQPTYTQYGLFEEIA